MLFKKKCEFTLQRFSDNYLIMEIWINTNRNENIRILFLPIQSQIRQYRYRNVYNKWPISLSFSHSIRVIMQSHLVDEYAYSIYAHGHKMFCIRLKISDEMIEGHWTVTFIWFVFNHGRHWLGMTIQKLLVCFIPKCKIFPNVPIGYGANTLYHSDILFQNCKIVCCGL